MMNIIFSFDSADKRQTFLARVSAEDSKLVEGAYLAKQRPDAIFESLSVAQAARLRELVHGLGRSFDDIKFDTMSPR